MYYSNAQWAVTKDGIQSIPPAIPYEIDAARLTEATYEPGQLYDWPVHMAEKTWVDIDLFIDAYLHALIAHHGAYGPTPDLDVVRSSLAEARKRKRLYGQP